MSSHTSSKRKNPKRSWAATAFTQISKENPMPPNPPSHTLLHIGDTVETIDGRVGVVRFIGEVDAQKGIWIGVELNEPNGNHDGKLKGKRYFKTAANHATFIKQKKIKRIVKSVQKNNKLNINRPNPITINSIKDSTKKEKKAFFESDASQSESESDSNGIEIDMDNINNYRQSPSTIPMSNDSNSDKQSASTISTYNMTAAISPPPPAPKSPDNDIDVADDTAGFDIESFRNIKEKLNRALNKECVDILNFSQMFDDKLKDKKKFNKTMDRLQKYIEGLIESTHDILNNAPPNFSELAAEVNQPFNMLSDKILSIDMFKYGHLCFHITLKYIEMLSFLEEIVWIPLQYIAMILPSAIGIRLLFEMPHKLHIFPPIHVHKVCKRVVEGSQFPIAICLKIAEFTKIISKNASAYCEEYDKLYEHYTNIAIDIIRDINSDHAALICLECPTDLEPTSEPPLDCLQIAIRSENGTFIANKRVMAILHGMWECSSFIEGDNTPHAHDHFSSYDSINFFALLTDHYRSFPAMPCGKYIIHLLLFVCEVVLLSFFAARRLTLSSPFIFFEAILWLFGLSSAVQSVYMTLNNHRLFRMTIADLSSLFLGFNFGILAGIRFYYLLDNRETGNLYSDFVIVFETIYAFTMILAFLRVSTLLSMSKTFGLLLIIVQKMTADITNFALLWLLFFFGFVFAEYYYIAKYIDDSFSLTLGAIFGISTGGDVDFDKYAASDTMSKSRSIVSQIMLVLLVLFGALLLINLFIAMMAKTFQELSNKSNTQWSLNVATFIVQYDRRNDVLPPPFNVIVYVIVLLWYMIEIPVIFIFNYHINPFATTNLSAKQLSFTQKLSAIIYGQKDVCLCTYCHCIQQILSNEDRIKDLKKWMSRIGLDTRDRTAILSCDAVLCQHCKRVIKRSETRYEWIADTVSYCIAYIVILPVILILCVPTGSLSVLWERLIGVEKNDTNEFYQLLYEKQKQHIGNTDPLKMRKLFAQKRVSGILEKMRKY